ncbi:hypothetical protein GCM10010191_88520 [Actinomadura vinacea]|uniref:Uncharacterized protein n=1 Tax=Actinomadura vinacea TaxID=115336 RepID=A0ABN3KC45_9ACTN
MLVIVLLAVCVLAVLGALGLWLLWSWFDYDMRNPQESGWMD